MSDSGLSQLAITNFRLPSHFCTSLPEYSPPEGRNCARYYSLDPSACSRDTAVFVVDAASSAGRYGLRTLLRNSLELGKRNAYVSWWLKAVSVDVLHSSLLELCDALDPSTSVSEWGVDVFAEIWKTFTEQQRVRTRCCVLVLDDAPMEVIHHFMASLCPAWGLCVYIIPASAASAEAVVALTKQFTPNVVDATISPSVLFADSSVVAEDGAQREAEVQSFRAQGTWVPSLLKSMLPVAAQQVVDGTFDDSYLNKFMHWSEHRVILLRAVLAAITPVSQGAKTMDTYEAYHAVCLKYDTLVKEFPSANASDVKAAATFRVLAEAIDSQRTASHGDTRASAVQQLQQLAVLPAEIPESLLEPWFSTLLIDVAGVSMRLEPQDLFASSSVAIVASPEWLLRSLLSVSSPEDIRVGVGAALMCIDHHDTSALRYAEYISDAKYFRLHDTLHGGPQRVQKSDNAMVLSPVDATSTPSWQQRQRHVNPNTSGGYQDDVESLASSVSEVCDDTESHAEVSPPVSDPRRGGPAPRASSSSRILSQNAARCWVRRRCSVVGHLLREHIHKHRLYFPRSADQQPLSAGALWPPIRRSLEELTHGLPTLPEDESLWTPVMGNLFCKYAQFYRSNKDDPLMAASALERALCVYLSIFDAAASNATSKFATLLSPKLPNSAEEMRRKSTSLHRRAASRRSMVSENDDSSVGTGSIYRRMSRLTAMTHDSQQSSRNGGGEGAGDDQAYAHVISLLLLGIERLYREIAACYHTAHVQGVAIPLLDRGIAALDMLNAGRRDTPARAVSSYRQGERHVMLSEMERRRAFVIQQSKELQDDEGDMKLRALVRSDVEERHHLRDAANAMRECLQVLTLNHCTSLTAPMTATCHEVIARQYLTDVSDARAAEHAELALSSALVDATVPLSVPVDPIWRSKQMEVDWALANASIFIAAIQQCDYTTAHEMLDRSSLLAAVCVPDLRPTGAPHSAVVVCDGCGDATEMLVAHSYPEPTLSTHLQLWTTFSEVQIAGHHGLDWSKAPVMYHIPLHTLLVHMNRIDEAVTAGGNRLLRRLVEECGANPTCCSPDKMKTALHIAIERQLADVVEYLLRHPSVDPLVSSPHVLRGERRGLSTLPCIERLPNPLPCPLLFCPTTNNDLLLLVLMHSKDPMFTFSATKFIIVERLAQDRDAFRLLQALFGEGAPFASELRALLLSQELCSETREALAQHAPRELVEWGLAHLNDDHIVLSLCASIAKHWGRAGAKLLQQQVEGYLKSERWDMANALITRHPNSVVEDELPYDLHKALKRWRAADSTQCSSASLKNTA